MQSQPRVGHWPTLFACFLHFDLSFMIWVLFGALGIFISEELHLSPAQKGLLVALPILTGSVMRVPLGMLSDRLGGKRVGALLLAFLVVPLLWGWLGAAKHLSVLGVGLLLGVSGASFAVALPLASRWYPAGRQGLAMGVAAAGNSGTTLTHLFAPALALIVGWRSVLGWTMLPLAVVLVAFLLLAREPPRTERKAVASESLWRTADLWWFCAFYSITFGGYVGLSSFLPLMLRDQYGMTAVAAGQLTALAAFTGSAARPLGGYVADKVGGVRMLLLLLLGVGVLHGVTASLPPKEMLTLTLIAAMACLGLGNGAVFQLVPQRFPGRIGEATGIIGAVGGLGGFLVPTFLGLAKERTGSFGAGFVAMAGAAGTAAFLLALLAARQPRWREWLSTVS
ncbi:MAG: MFS transporter [Myxococcaceae bacterium]